MSSSAGTLLINPYVKTIAGADQVVTATSNSRNIVRAARGPIVLLLKNENKTLPLSKEIRNIAVIGPQAELNINQLPATIAQPACRNGPTRFEGSARRGCQPDVCQKDVIVRDKNFPRKAT